MRRIIAFASLLLGAGTLLSAQQPLSDDDIIKRIREGVWEDLTRRGVEEEGCDCESSPVSIESPDQSAASPMLILAVRESRKPLGQTIGWAPSPPQSSPSSAGPTKWTVFAGYSYGRLATSGLGGDLNTHGFNFAVSGHVSEWIAITGDVSGHFFERGFSDVSVFNFAAGPALTRRRGRVRCFSRFLAGAGRISVGTFDIDATETSFSTVFGGAIDVGITERFAIRVIQSDWLRLWDIGGGEDLNMWRLSFGVVGRF